MSGDQEISLCEPVPFMFHENGQLGVTDGCSVWIVIVTHEAMAATASPPDDSLNRLVRYAEYYRALAAAAIERGEDFDGKVWIAEAAVLSAPLLPSLHDARPERTHAQYGA